MSLFRQFAGLGGWADALPHETTILRFRHMLERHKLAPTVLKAGKDAPSALPSPPTFGPAVGEGQPRQENRRRTARLGRRVAGGVKY
ncbi:hypothetical protein CLD22_00775 [Rubrivivax gelatinosus]|nr:hypothetical protein [Rubrivivax gelatinosus]